jgi:hypothetical protein
LEHNERHTSVVSCDRVRLKRLKWLQFKANAILSSEPAALSGADHSCLVCTCSLRISGAAEASQRPARITRLSDIRVFQLFRKCVRGRQTRMERSDHVFKKVFLSILGPESANAFVCLHRCLPRSEFLRKARISRFQKEEEHYISNKSTWRQQWNCLSIAYRYIIIPF